MESDTDVRESPPGDLIQLDCTKSSCTQDEDIHKLECAECKRLVHYKCTQLPVYQVQLFLTKGYRKFICVNCIDVPKYLMEILADNQARETSNKDKGELSRLKREVTACENIIKVHEENETKLKDIITSQNDELKEQEEKFNEAGNPDFDVIKNLEGSMKKKLEQIGMCLKESLLKEVQENNKKMEEKLNQVMSLSNSYANTVKNIQASEKIQTSTNVNTDFRTIMREARNEELVEEQEKRLRACNLIIHGVNESDSDDKEVAKKMDEKFITSMIGAVHVSTVFKSHARIGQPDPVKRRPIKVVLNCEEDRNKIIASLSNLKGQQTYKGISITEDYTIADRQLIKRWSEKAKESNANEAPDSKYVWRVRGNPKNGLILKKFLKRNPAVLQA